MSAIEEKWQALLVSGLDLGRPLGPEQPIADGRFRRYERGAIFQSPRAGVHEIHGGILQRYHALGGPGVNPGTGHRELGFPTTDQIRTADGQYSANLFEGGAIYWIPEVGGVALWGSIYESWSRYFQAELGRFGYPLADPTPVAGGQAVFFASGMVWRGHLGGDLVFLDASFDFPMLGNPDLVARVAAGPLALDASVLFGLGGALRELVALHRPQLMLELWRDRLALWQVVPRGQPRPAPIPLVARPLSERPTNDPVRRRPVIDRTAPLGIGDGASRPGDVAGTEVRVVFDVPAESRPLLVERGLYDLCLQVGPNLRPVARHCVYVKSDWNSFGLIHATDTHVSRRLDAIPARLRELGLADAAARFNNCNDNVRDLVRTANRLHERGAVDLVVLTGDLVEALYDPEDNSAGGGNMAFFEKLLLGEGAPEGEPAEELRVPLYTVLGEHDVKAFSHDLVYDLEPPARLRCHGGLDELEAQRVHAYRGLNLAEPEARALQGDAVPRLGTAHLARLAARRDPTYYRRHINCETSYLVRLGAHRLVLLDTGWEQCQTLQEALFAHGAAGADAEMLVRVAPPLRGYDERDIALLRRALQEAGNEGLVFVAAHGPPLQLPGGEYPHFLRETEHAGADPLQVSGFLLRHGAPSFLGSEASEAHPSWFHPDDAWFKSGDVTDLLDEGSSRGQVGEFLRVCVGRAARRPVDLVLCGHSHRHAEFRLEWDDVDRLRFFTDFYTANPSRAYDSWRIPTALAVRLRTSGQDLCAKEPKELRELLEAMRFERFHVVINGGEVAVPRGRATLAAPQYPRPLDRTPISALPGWWAAHRPMILQTAALGPYERGPRLDPVTDDATFQGFRVVRVVGGVIQRIWNASLPELRKQELATPFDG